VLYNEQSAWSDLFRRPQEESLVPSVTGALLCLALMFPVWFICRGVLAQVGGLSTLALLGFMALTGSVLFAGFPLVWANRGRVRLRTGMQLQAAPVAGYGGALLMGLSLWPVVVQLLAFVLPAPNILERDSLEDLLKPFRQAREDYPLVIGLVFVIQALAEEFFFRGYLFSALRGKSGPLTTVIVSALLFGFFHVIAMPGPFAMYRFLSSVLLGLVLGWVAWHSGSVFPGMILHATHNAMLVLFGPGEVGFDLLPWLLVGAGVWGSVAGAVLFQIWGRPKRIENVEQTQP
jgi:membrane protease YdiL (CAAX protease family)